MGEKNLKIILIVAMAVLLAGLIFITFKLIQKPKVLNNPNNLPMKLTSPAFVNNQYLPSKYTCDGNGINPILEFTDRPNEAKSLALIFDDPDAPAGTFVHWVIWNLLPDTAQLDEGALPGGAIVGKNTTGENNYVPPCPPSGVHHYTFKLYALDIVLNLSPTTDKAGLETAMQGHVLSQAELVGLYSRGN